MQTVILQGRYAGRLRALNELIASQETMAELHERRGREAQAEKNDFAAGWHGERAGFHRGELELLRQRREELLAAIESDPAAIQHAQARLIEAIDPSRGREAPERFDFIDQ